MPRVKAPLVLLAVVAALLATLGSGCNPPGPGDKQPAAASQDAAVITAALEHFAKREHFLAQNTHAKTLIVVDPQTIGPYRYDRPHGDERGARLFPGDNYENLVSRNADRVSLKEMKLGRDVVFADLSQFDLLFGGFEEAIKQKYAGIEQTCYASLWLPGYSSDRSTAVVKFEFGPTSHGATATYLLKKQDDKWIVSDYDFAYSF
jgi:hypothetical protein